MLYYAAPTKRTAHKAALSSCLQKNDPDNMRRVRCAPRKQVVPMRHLQDALLWPGLPEAALEEGRPQGPVPQIKSGGGAEQYHADRKYKEAVAVAVKKCAADTKGQTCYICTEALHWKTKEGLVRGCSCRGTAGFAHVSCLAEQAKILVAEAEENNLGAKALEKRYARWVSCGLCKQQEYHGVVFCALGWACWKTYVGRPEKDLARKMRDDAAWRRFIRCKSVRGRVVREEAELSMRRRLGEPEEITCSRRRAILRPRMQILDGWNRPCACDGKPTSDFRGFTAKRVKTSLAGAVNYCYPLLISRRFEEAKSLLRKSDARGATRSRRESYE